VGSVQGGALVYCAGWQGGVYFLAFHYFGLPMRAGLPQFFRRPGGGDKATNFSRRISQRRGHRMKPVNPHRLAGRGGARSVVAALVVAPSRALGWCIVP
jgi:hypothetical protein